MIHKDNTPTFNVNRRIDNYKDFINNKQKEKEELEKMDKTEIPNSDTNHQIIGNRRHKYNKVSHKIDDLSPNEIDDKLDTIKNESVNDMTTLELSTNYFALKPDDNFNIDIIEDDDIELEYDIYLKEVTDYMFTIYERNFKSIIPFTFKLIKGDYHKVKNYNYNNTDSLDMDMICDFNKLLEWLNTYTDNFDFIMFIKEHNKSTDGYVSFEPTSKSAFISAISTDINKALVSVFNYEYDKMDLLDDNISEIQNYILEHYKEW
ncbi:MAG: hypothetical protein M0R46_13560 [Candidatus Muirbacterium halophilum]|nr:hypothetical protein [Candidatus Muirbacterium halophilum]